MIETHRNWAGNYTYSAVRLHRPTTVEEVQAIVSRARQVKALGARHSFNPVADTTEDHISLEQLNRVVSLDPERRTVTVEAGIKYGQLGQQLHQAGYAVHNMASLPHISVAGAISTATHGSGDRNGNLATAVAALEIVTADGELVTLSREDGAEFYGAVVGLGGLGVVTRVTLDIEPTFEVRQVVYEDLPLARLTSEFDPIMSSAYSVSLFNDWRTERVNQVWLKSRVTDAPFDMPTDFFGATLAESLIHPIKGMPIEPLTEQRGIPGPWHERLPHFRLEHTPSAGAELQSEYFVPRSHAVAAIRAIAGLGPLISPLLMIGEVRTVAADNLWMSMCYQQDRVGIHFTWVQDWEGVRTFLPTIEAALAPFEARPHWGKLFTMEAAHLQSLYPRLSDFRALLRRYDPQGKFRNAFLDTYIFGAE